MPKISNVKARRRLRSKSHHETHTDLEQRLTTEKLINQKLTEVKYGLFDICLENSEFKNSLVDIRSIGSGAFGNVFIAKLPDSPYFVMKEALLNKEEIKRLEYSKAKSIIIRNSYPDEYKTMTLVNDAIYSENIPNFILSYNLAICNSCRDGNICYTSFIEPAMGTMNLIKSYTRRICVSATIQLLAALYWLHSKYGIYHGDLKSDNILILPWKTYGSTLYKVNKKNYIANNVGFLFCINDFGLSQTFKPNFSTQNYLGTRNAKVVNGLLEPFSSKYCLNFATTRSEPTITAPIPNEWGYTINRFSTTVNIIPSISVDLNDTLTFPPFEFFYDIQNILGLMTGEYSTYHTRYHEKLQNLDKNFFRLISSHIARTFPYEKNSGRFIRSDMMLDYIYEDLKSLDAPDSDIVSEWVV